jgi:hypothetical protein
MKQLFIIFIFLSFSNVFSQFGNGMGNGMGNRMGAQNQMNQIPNDSAKKADEPSADEIVAPIVEMMKERLKLDGLQEVAVSQILIKSVKTRGIVLKSEINQDAKAKELEDLRKNSSKEIESMLNANQKAEYKLMQEEKPGDYKPKKDKKKRDKKE